MTQNLRIPVQMLGQSGCRFSFPDATVYLDPYLSNSVQVLDAHDLERQLPIPFPPEKVTDADFVLITHEHIDHCDPHTLPLLAESSPQACFIGPAPVLKILAGWGIDPDRLILVIEEWITLAPALRVRAIPAAHPEIERDIDGNLANVGYLLDCGGQQIYLAGDTSIRQEIIDVLIAQGSIHTAFLPVNECNFFRSRRGIIGNMSVREAFKLASEIGIKQVVAVHWDMFAINAVDPEEIRLIHRHMDPAFALLIQPSVLNLGGVQVSIVIRTFNEAQHLESLLERIATQQTNGFRYEVVLVDSGSTDGTLEIAQRYGCQIQQIKREEFSFGRSLNMGCEAARGEIIVIISGHCVPTDEHWMQKLCQPILEEKADYCYGRQICGSLSRFSEGRIFAKYYPEKSSIPQEGFFCNNANAAISRQVWINYNFNEILTGLEDMELAQRLIRDERKVAYVADACVTHHHQEPWQQVKHRFEREAIALQNIMPQVHVHFFDMIRYIQSSIWKDWQYAWRKHVWHSTAWEIVLYRINQYYGSFKGNHEHRKLSHIEKEKYFFPR